MTTVTNSTGALKAFDEAWARLDDEGRARVNRADEFYLVKRRGQWVILLKRPRLPRLRGVKHVAKV